jgi:hypothetical protein
MKQHLSAAIALWALSAASTASATTIGPLPAWVQLPAIDCVRSPCPGYPQGSVLSPWKEEKVVCVRSPCQPFNREGYSLRNIQQYGPLGGPQSEKTARDLGF